jgi:hypothetical protein
MPTLQRPNIKPQLPMKFSRSPVVGAIHQGRNLHDEHFGIDLPSQEAHRHRSVPEATSFGRAAEAITPVPMLREFVRNSTRFARIISPVELATAGSAAALSGFLGQPAVDLNRSWKNREFCSSLNMGPVLLKLLQARSLAPPPWGRYDRTHF